MDLDFLLDEVMTDVIPLDWDAVINSQLPLKVVASSLTTLRSEVLTGFRDRSDLVECLKASANVPEIVGGPRSHRGHQLVDAAVFEPLPIKAALRWGSVGGFGVLAGVMVDRTGPCGASTVRIRVSTYVSMCRGSALGMAVVSPKQCC
jgi:predicted patatin/cPLA2 family phospholipase